MSPLTAILLAACATSPAADRTDAAPEYSIEGRVLLPEGEGRRGTEVRLIFATPEGGERFTWVQTDADGRFSYTGEAPPLRAVVHAAGVDVHTVPVEAGAGVPIALEVLDLRERLLPHRLTLVAAEGSPAGDVRVAPWAVLPPPGPMGEMVSLGSAQFPELALSDTVEWLLPKSAETITFLTERPDGEARGRAWRTGPQQLFGPYPLTELPDELVIE
jgi:hypothetical protein